MCEGRGARSDKKECNWSSTSSRELEIRVEQSTAQSCHCGTCSKASTSPRSLGPAAKTQFHSQKSQRNPFEVHCPHAVLQLSGFASVAVIAGVDPSTGNGAQSYSTAVCLGRGARDSERLKLLSVARISLGFSLTALGTTHTFSRLINPFPWCRSQHQLTPIPY